MLNPKKSFNCPTKIPMAIPKVKPTVMVLGIKLIKFPNFNKPMTIIIKPAKKVAVAKPLMPYCETMP